MKEFGKKRIYFTDVYFLHFQTKNEKLSLEDEFTVYQTEADINKQNDEYSSDKEIHSSEVEEAKEHLFCKFQNVKIKNRVEFRIENKKLVCCQSSLIFRCVDSFILLQNFQDFIQELHSGKIVFLHPTHPKRYYSYFYCDFCIGRATYIYYNDYYVKLLHQCISTVEKWVLLIKRGINEHISSKFFCI
jgi:hypothetical protein